VALRRGAKLVVGWVGVFKIADEMVLEVAQEVAN